MYILFTYYCFSKIEGRIRFFLTVGSESDFFPKGQIPLKRSRIQTCYYSLSESGGPNLVWKAENCSNCNSGNLSKFDYLHLGENVYATMTSKNLVISYNFRQQVNFWIARFRSHNNAIIWIYMCRLQVFYLELTKITLYYA